MNKKILEQNQNSKPTSKNHAKFHQKTHLLPFILIQPVPKLGQL
tara:strand:- start:1024 stop:1155 length:132 start_codon:yes stop_codon:yes gene_type:complete